MSAAARVIVTRPTGQADAWVQGLQAQGFAAQSFPLIEIAEALEPGTRAAWQARVFGVPEFAVCISPFK
jgi:uroporphyrinogen-III synthase